MMPAWLNPRSLWEEVPNFSKVQSDLGIEKATLEAKHIPKVPFSSQVLSSRLKSVQEAALSRAGDMFFLWSLLWSHV